MTLPGLLLPVRFSNVYDRLRLTSTPFFGTRFSAMAPSLSVSRSQHLLCDDNTRQTSARKTTLDMFKPRRNLKTSDIVCQNARFLSTDGGNIPAKPAAEPSVSYRDLSWPSKIFIRTVVGYRDYGLTALTFHAVVAGCSILFWWYLVYNQYDVVGWLARIGFVSPFSLLLSNISQAFGAASFPLAYSIHKAFAPVRFVLTAVAAPFIVKALRKRHIFRLPPGMRP